MQKIFLSVLLLSLLFTPTARAEDSDFNRVIQKYIALTPQEVKEAEARKAVYHANSSGLPGGQATVFVNATPQEAWNSATDFEHYMEFIPGTLVMNVIDRDEKTANLHGEYKSTWPYSKIMLDTINYFDNSDPNQLQVVWKSTKTNMKQAFGFWVIKAHGTGSLVTYAMEFDLDWIPRFVAAHNGRMRVIEIANAVRARAESRSENKPGELQAEKKNP